MHWRRIAGAATAIGLVGVAVPRYLWFRRLPLPSGSARLILPAAGAMPRLEVAHLAGGHAQAVILAHGFLKTMRTPGIVGTMRALADRFDVLALDFAGHGLSGGESRCNFCDAADDLRRVVALARRMGYARVGVVGYSMGAAAAILAAASGSPIDAVAAISAPACSSGRRAALAGQAVRPWRWWLRLMGTRVAPMLEAGTWPQEVIAQVAPIPLLVVQSGRDTLIRRGDGEALYTAAQEPKDRVFLPHALHSAPAASRAQVVAWLADRLGPGQ